MMMFLEVTNIGRKEGEQTVLHHITFKQLAKQNIAIVGETGSGKSSLLKIIGGLLQPTEGVVLFEGQRVEGPLEKLVPGHAGIAYLSQHFELPKFLRVEQILDYANTLSDAQATLLYEICQIDHLLKRKTDQLSGGERQRIALAKNLITSPSLLLLDEPYSNLDLSHKSTLKRIVEDLCTELNTTCILVSHDPVDILPWADKLIVMRNGTIVQKGPPELIYTDPVDEYTASLFGKFTTLDAQLQAIFQLSIKEGEKFFLRPEEFSITPYVGLGVDGIIREIRYFGSNYEVEVYIGNIPVTVSVVANAFFINQKVRVEIVSQRVPSQAFPQI